MAEQDSKGNLGAWLTFFGVVIGAAVTLFLGLYNRTPKPPDSDSHPPEQRQPGTEKPTNDPPAAKPRIPPTQVADAAPPRIENEASVDAAGSRDPASSANLCALAGSWTAINVNQQVSWPAHFSDGMLIVQATFANNTQGRFKYRCTATGSGISLIGAGSEAYGQEMPFSFNIFDGEYVRTSATTFKGHTSTGEQLLLASQ